MKDKPIIKTFIEGNKYYLYDTYSNRLFEITKEHYFELSELKKYGINKYLALDRKTEAYKAIVLLINKGLLRSSIIRKIEHPETKYVEYLIDRHINGMTLQVTKKCNFSCRYCVINTDNNIGRSHENIDMSWEIAKKSIEFLYHHAVDSPTITIAFYGGEPMLNFDLIEKSITYATQLFYTKQLKFMMTINGSVLSENMIKFLSKHKVDIAISIDGPAHIQNKHRKFGKNGQDTFAVVYNNIKRIQDIDIDYYNNHVQFIPVVFRDENYQEILNFFMTLEKTEKDIRKLDVSLNGIDYVYSEELDLKQPEYIDYDVAKKNNKLMEIYNNKTELPATWHHNGPCLPTDRILINTEGEINMCEKVENLKIGDINIGIDKNLAKKYLNIGSFTEDDCKNCWAMRFCNMCIMNCLDMDNYSVNISRKKENCKRTKIDTLLFFKNCIIK